MLKGYARVHVSKRELRKYPQHSDNLSWHDRLHYAGFVEDKEEYAEQLMLDLDRYNIFYRVRRNISDLSPSQGA